MPNISWEEISEIIHRIRSERTAFRSIDIRLENMREQVKYMDRKLMEFEESLNKLILLHEEEA